MSILVLDTETTGLGVINSRRKMMNPKKIEYYEKARLVELGIIEYVKNEDRKWELKDKYSFLIKPDNFTIENENIHGISHKEATEHGMNIKDVLVGLGKLLQRSKLVLAYNFNFDYNIILSECYRYDLVDIIESFISIRKICVMKMSKDILKLERFIKLKDLYFKLFNKETEEKLHRASGDAMVCGDCFFELKNKHQVFQK